MTRLELPTRPDMTGPLERDRPPQVLPVPLALGLQEGARIVRHPISLVGAALLLTAVATIGDNSSGDAFHALTTAPTVFYGVFVYFAANLVASRDRRAESDELLAAAPSPVTSRVAGLCAGALVPALVCTAFVVAVHGLNHARGLYDAPPGFFQLAQGPLTVLGGALLGIMVARLAPVPGAALLAMAAMFAWNLWTTNSGGSDLQLLGTFMSWERTQPGSVAWHDAYLLGLCAMAATGAFLRDAQHRFRVLCLGGGCTAAAVVAGIGQLP